MGGGALSQAVYGWPPSSLVEVSDDAIQLSPFDPRAVALSEIADGELASAVIAAPAGAVERRFVLAQALRALQAGGLLTALAPKNRGGSRLAADLRWFGCDPAEDARRHYRICRCSRPAAAENLDAAISLGRLQIAPSLGLWSQPGVFSWDRLDKGSAALLERGLTFNGDGADLGCGVGVLAREVLAGPGVTRLLLVDIDARAIAAAKLNVGDRRASFAHADVRNLSVLPADLDFVVMNPPFHHEGRQSLALGQQFIAAAAAALRKGGLCRMVANAGLAYEVSLARAFSVVVQLARGDGYKIFEAIK